MHISYDYSAVVVFVVLALLWSLNWQPQSVCCKQSQNASVKNRFRGMHIHMYVYVCLYAQKCIALTPIIVMYLKRFCHITLLTTSASMGQRQIVGNSLAAFTAIKLMSLKQ